MSLPTIDRTTVIAGPALLEWKNISIYTKDDIVLDPQKTTFDIPTSRYGKQTDQRLKDYYYKVSGTQAGEVSAAILAVISQFGDILPGESIFGDNDEPLKITSFAKGTGRTGERYTLHNSVPSKITDLALRPDATLFGGFEFTCIGRKGVPFNDPDRLMAISTKVVRGNITTTSHGNPDVVTFDQAHGFELGDIVTISGVKGDTAINGVRVVDTIPSNTTATFKTLGGAVVAGNAAYVSGGKWALGAAYSNANVITSSYSASWATVIPSGSISGAGVEGAIEITTTAPHGLVVGDRVKIVDVEGNTNANGTFLVKGVGSAATFTIQTLAGVDVEANDDYTGGGAFTRVNGLDAFDTENGFQISFSLSLTNKTTQGVGLYDIRFSSLTVKAKGKPVGPTPAEMLRAINGQGANVQIGQSLAKEGQDLNITGTGLYFRLTQAAITANRWLFGPDNNRIDDVEWVATRADGTDNERPLFEISTAPLD